MDGLYEAESAFPDLSGDRSAEQKMRDIEDYLYQLLEALRYALRNISPDNFNDREIGAWVDGITAPIRAEITDTAAGLSTRIDVNAAGIASEVSRATAAEGSLSSRVTQTADGLASEVSRAAAAEGLMQSSIEQNAEAITTKVSKNGVISEINQTAEQVRIDAQRLALTGAITWDDLSAAAKERVDAGKGDANPSYIKSTYIDSTEIRSPTIRAGDFYGALYHDDAGAGTLDLSSSLYRKRLRFGADGQSFVNCTFGVDEYDDGDYQRAALRLFGMELLHRLGFGTDTVYADGDWVFTGGVTLPSDYPTRAEVAAMIAAAAEE